MNKLFLNLVGYASKPNNMSHISWGILGAVSKTRNKTKKDTVLTTTV